MGAESEIACLILVQAAGFLVETDTVTGTAAVMATEAAVGAGVWTGVAENGGLFGDFSDKTECSKCTFCF